MVKSSHGFNGYWLCKRNVFCRCHLKNISVILFGSPLISSFFDRTFFTGKPSIPWCDSSSTVPYGACQAHKLLFQFPGIFIIDKGGSSSKSRQFALTIVIEILGI